MADDTTDPASRPPDFRAETIEKLGALADSGALLKWAKWIYGIAAFTLQNLLQLIFSLWGKIVATLIRLVAAGMKDADPAFGEVAKAGISALFGVEVSPASLQQLTDRGAREGLKQDVGRAMMSAITGAAGDGGGGEITPSIAPALAYLGTVADFAIEGWLMGMLGELESLGYLERFGDLKDTIGRMFGFGRLTRRILGPIIDATIVTPAKWQINQTYRPTRLPTADAVREFLRGRWTDAQMREELSRDGYSDDRIEALVNGLQKMFGAGDVRTFVDRGFWTNDQGLQHLRDQGWDEDGAAASLRLEGLRIIEELEAQEASAIVERYAAGDIEDADFVQLLEAHISNETKRTFTTELGRLRRGLLIKHLSATDAADCVKAGILAVSDYRSALRREGYDEDAVMAKELLLRWQLDKATAIADQRKQAEADRAAEKAAKAQAAAAKLAQVQADRALKQLGTPGALERAVVRGLIPVARYQEVLAPNYDADTVQILTELVEQQRADYVAQQQKVADAKKAAANRNIDVSQLESAVLHGVLSLDEYKARLVYLKFSDADATLLTDTLKAKVDDQAAAEKKREEAAAKAAQKHISLSTFEQLVRRGHRTIAEYDALLASLGYDDGDRAAMVDLLQLKIGDDKTAADKQAAIDATRKPGELTIAQFRKAVILGLKTESDFDAFLTSLNVSPDEHALFVAELHNDVMQADAARQRRGQVVTRSDARDLPLATVHDAARLGLITPAVYQQRLARDGYTADDIAIEMDLLTVEISDAQGARQIRSQADATIGTKGLTLAQLAKAVKAGEAPLEQYRARAIAIGLSPDDADTITRVLGDEVAATKAAKARRDAINSTLQAGNVSLAVLESQVQAGTMTIADYVAELGQLGIAPEDADLLGSLLSDQINGGAAPSV